MRCMKGKAVFFFSISAVHIHFRHCWTYEIKFNIGLGTEVRRTNNICAIRSTNILTLHGTERILLAFLKAADLTRNSTSHRM